MCKSLVFHYVQRAFDKSFMFVNVTVLLSQESDSR